MALAITIISKCILVNRQWLYSWLPKHHRLLSSAIAIPMRSLQLNCNWYRSSNGWHTRKCKARGMATDQYCTYCKRTVRSWLAYGASASLDCFVTKCPLKGSWSLVFVGILYFSMVVINTKFGLVIFDLTADVEWIPKDVKVLTILITIFY